MRGRYPPSLLAIQLIASFTIGALLSVPIAWLVMPIEFALGARMWATQEMFATRTRMVGYDLYFIRVAEDTWSTSPYDQVSHLNTPDAPPWIADLDVPNGNGLVVERVHAGFPFRCLQSTKIQLLAISDLPGQLIAEETTDTRGSRYIIQNTSHGLVGFPTKPLWLGVIANAVTYAFVIWSVIVVGLLIRRSARRARGRCPRCAYDLAGDLTPGCPECGWNRDDVSSTLPTRRARKA